MSATFRILDRQIVRISIYIRILDRQAQYIPGQRILLVCLRYQNQELRAWEISMDPKP